MSRYPSREVDTAGPGKAITYLSEFAALGLWLGSWELRQTSRSRRALTTASDFEWTCSLR
jgi:hypothetical protein